MSETLWPVYNWQTRSGIPVLITAKHYTPGLNVETAWVRHADPQRDYGNRGWLVSYAKLVAAPWLEGAWYEHVWENGKRYKAAAVYDDGSATLWRKRWGRRAETRSVSAGWRSAWERVA